MLNIYAFLTNLFYKLATKKDTINNENILYCRIYKNKLINDYKLSKEELIEMLFKPILINSDLYLLMNLDGDLIKLKPYENNMLSDFIEIKYAPENIIEVLQRELELCKRLEQYEKCTIIQNEINAIKKENNI